MSKCYGCKGLLDVMFFVWFRQFPICNPCHYTIIHDKRECKSEKDIRSIIASYEED